VCSNPGFTTNPNAQPCRRCQREARECILGESHRGGRRVRKKPKLEDQQDSNTASAPNGSLQTSPNTDSHFSPHASETSTLTPSLQPRYNQQEPDGQGFTWHQTTSSATTRSTSEAEGAISQRPAEHNTVGHPTICSRWIS